jgi:hypothetical protein
MRPILFFCLLERVAVFAGMPLVLFTNSALATLATPKYIQGNYAVPQTSQTTVTVPLTAAQTAGNLNVVIVGWNDSYAHVSSVKDSKGNVYQLAVGPTLTGTLSQAIYYAKNIAAAAAATNAVTVTFSTAAAFPDIRVVEYSGIDPVNPVDRFVGAVGYSTTSNSGTLTTTTATDLLVGANTVQTYDTGPGSGFTQRLLTKIDGDIAEDRVVTVVGSYSASASLGTAGGWVMQMVAFRAATVSSVTIVSGSSSATLAWNANLPTSSAATNTVGYRLHMGLASGVYTQITTLGNVITVTVSKLVSGTVYYFVVTAYNSAGVDGPPSNQVSYKAP